MKNKLYPFPISQSHNIELVKYMAINQDNDYVRQECNDVLCAIMDTSNNKVAWLDGKTLAKAKELSLLGASNRAEMNLSWANRK